MANLFFSARNLASAFLLLTLVITGAQAQNSITASSMAAAFQLDKAGLPEHKALKDFLLQKSRQAGGVRLIVELRTETVPEHKLSASGWVAQRNRIAEAQKAFLQKIVQKQGRELKRFKTLPYVVVEGNENFLQALLDMSGNVASIQEDRLHFPSLAESVPLIGGDKAWSAGATGAGQTVAIIDSGVDSTHPFLNGKVVAEACYSTSSGSTSTTVCPNGQNEQVGTGAGRECTIAGCLHGTHVAGIAAGKGNDFSGVAKDANIIAVQVFSTFHSGCGSTSPCISAYTSDIIKGLEYVYSLRDAYKIAAINMSLGGGSYYSNCDTDAMKKVIDNLRAAGIATVIASGNESKTYSIASPACISSAISVGATTKTDTVASYSNSAKILTMLAPGSAINSSVPDGKFQSLNGTSMATPHVTGAIAVLRSAQPAASVDTLQAALLSAGKPVKDSRNYLTKPRLDIHATLAKLGGAGSTTTTTGISTTTSSTAATTTTTSSTTTTTSGVCYSESVSGTCSAHYSAGRLNVSQYLSCGSKVGYTNAVTLYKSGSTWTNKSNCAALAF